MLGKTKMIWALVIALVLVSLSTQAATVTEPERPEYDLDEFDDMDFIDSLEVGETGLIIPEIEEWGERDGFVRIGLMVRWGLLGDERPGEEGERGILPSEHGRMVPWDGFLQTTDGGVKLVKTLLFEHGGEYEHGGDDRVYPRTNRFTLEWRSSTTVHWDGLLMILVIPTVKPMPHVTLHTESWSHVFEAWQLIGLHERIPVGDRGNEIEINGFLVKSRPEKPDFAVIMFTARWGYLDDELRGRIFKMVPWDGFISLTDGAVKLVKPLRFERGGDYEHGTDDYIYPRTNRLTLEWKSSTTTIWDGIAVALFIPLNTVPEAHMTFHTNQWSRVFDVRDLPGLHRRFATDQLGHEIEINGKLVAREPCECRGLDVGARVFARGQDGVENDVMIFVGKDGVAMEGAKVFVNGRFAGNTSQDGKVYVMDLPAGEYHVVAKLDKMCGRTAFEIATR
ncbi:MAG: hypothetical protein V3U09_01300 [Thermoplasmata archaeon]